ncbi:peptidase domain-containing ABC transporter [Yoonia sp.]|uniref:peptidase domain-containing ABC transporter n=1 Tax=Yoonia sp. TaxID=2212373 RepID=UPI0025D70634|nr:peptidase domain-containing ABC transporter [Yoonia sp.]
MTRAFSLIYQHDSKDCGPSCLQMIHRFHGGYISTAQMRILCDLTIDGVSMAGLARAADRLGMATQAARVTPDQLDTLPLPLIAHWLQEHFVVVVAVTRSTVRVADPELGFVTYKRQDFHDRWLGQKMFGEVKTDRLATEGAVLMVAPGQTFATHRGPMTVRTAHFAPLWPILRENRRAALTVLIVFPLLMAIAVALPLIMQRVIDDGVGGQNPGLLQLLLIGYLVLSLSRNVVGGLRDLLLLKLGAKISLEIVHRFMRQLLQLKMDFFERRSLGDLLQRQNDHHRIERFLTTQSLPTFFSLLTFLVFAVMLGTYSMMVLTCVVAFAGVTLVWIVAIGKRRRKFDLQQFELEGIVQDNAVEIISAVRDLKAFGRTRQKTRFYQSLLRRRFESTYRAARLDEMQSIGALLLMEAGEIIALMIAGRLVIVGDASLGVFVAILFILGQMRGPLSQMVPFFQSVQDALLSLNRLDALQEESAEPENAPADARLDALAAQDLRFDHVGFRYNPMHPQNVLTDLTFTIPAGKKTAIVGASGAGKSTLIKLLAKFHEPTDGVIRYGDIDLSQVAPQIWRERIGQVFQDGMIFNASLGYNITLSHDTPDRVQLARVLDVANVDAFLPTLTQGIETSIGRGGWQLSAGQKQRVLIARALYSDPEILIFDEATSALDSNNEAEITSNLQQMFAQRTSIVISHRLSTIRDADQIIVMDAGYIVASGTHDVLIANDGPYRRLFVRQTP